MKNIQNTNYKLWMILGSAFVAVVVLFYIFLVINGLDYRASTSETPQANLIVITANSIPTVDTSLLSTSATATIAPGMSELNGIALQKFVKISGTDGSGLRIRTGPGKNADIVFLANDSEVFLVVGGPSQSDGLVWWELAAPYDQNRKGWAAADYLELVEEQ